MFYNYFVEGVMMWASLHPRPRCSPPLSRAPSTLTLDCRRWPHPPPASPNLCCWVLAVLESCVGAGGETIARPLPVCFAVPLLASPSVCSGVRLHQYLLLGLGLCGPASSLPCTVAAKCVLNESDLWENALGRASSGSRNCFTTTSNGNVLATFYV